MDIPLPGISSTRPRKWVDYIPFDLINIAADTSVEESALREKILKSVILRRKLHDELLRISEHLRKYKPERDYLSSWIQLRTTYHHNYGDPDWMIKHVKFMEEEIEKRLYKHHGRVIKKHISIREQDDIIHILRRKMLHQRNTLAGEKRLIKDIKLAEEARANIIISNDMKIKTSYDYSYTKADVDEYKGRIVRERNEFRKRTFEFNRLDKDVKSWENQLTKIKKMKEDVTSYLSFLSIMRRDKHSYLHIQQHLGSLEP